MRESRKKRRGAKRVLTMCLVGTLVLFPTGCNSGDVEEPVPTLKEPVGVDVDTAVVKKMDFTSVQSFQGEIVPDIRGLYFVNSGNIDKMYVSPGDKVKKGQLLATLTSVESGVGELKETLAENDRKNREDNRISRCNLEQKQEELRQLKREYKKKSSREEKKSVRRKIVEKQEDIRIARLEITQQKETQAMERRFLLEDIRAAKKQTKDSKLISPVNGEIISTAGGSGYMVQGGVTAVNVADMESPRVRTSYIASSVLEKAGRCVAVINGKEYDIKANEQDLDALEIEMGEFPDNTWFDFLEKVKVRVGDSVSVEIRNEMTEDALVVPVNAVFHVKKEYYVYRMTDGVKKKVSVTIGAETDAYICILNGLEEGDVVYVQS